MTVYVELELTAYLLSVDDCRHVIISFIEQCQYSLVNIVVDKDNTFLCTLNQVGHESIGIINLPIVEHTLLRLGIALVQSAEYFVYALIGCFNVLIGILLMLQDFQLMIFHRFQTTKNRSIVYHKVTH